MAFERRGLRGWVWAGCAFAFACSGQGETVHATRDDAGEASVYCPATLEETNGHECGWSGLMCTEDFLCSELPQQTVCTCKSARFECHDPIGLLPPGDSPRCLSTDPKKYYCPESMALAEGLTCTANGQSCFYVGATCSNGVTKLNYCECVPDGFGGLDFACHIVPCEPTLEGGLGGD